MHAFARLIQLRRPLLPKNRPISLFKNAASNSLRFGQQQQTTRSLVSSSADNATNTNSNGIPFYGLPRPPPTEQEEGDSTSSSLKQRLVVALKSASTAFRDPTRDDAVAALGEVTGTLALHRILQQMRRHPTGRLILKDKPLVTKATIPYERFLEQAQTIKSQQQPDDTMNNNKNLTFGQAYGLFLLDHGFDPDERKMVQHMDNSNSSETAEDLAYVMMRYRQCHDYWHALTGLPPTVLGELGLKWLELFQTGLPIAALSGTVGSLGLSYKTATHSLESILALVNSSSSTTASFGS